MGGYGLYVILPDGSAYPLSGGGLGAEDGQRARVSASLPAHLTPGTYALGLRIDDDSGLSSSYNLPRNENNVPITDGSLSVTITP